MLVSLKRTYLKDATLGIMTVENRLDPIWYTIERPWLDNEKFVSCIPEGKYKVEPFSGRKYKDVWEIKDVENRTAILFHAANWVRQLHGCIAPGLTAGYIKDAKSSNEFDKAVRESANAVRQMKEVIGYPSTFDLEIFS